MAVLEDLELVEAKHAGPHHPGEAKVATTISPASRVAG
jgi:hypothetical protein